MRWNRGAVSPRLLDANTRPVLLDTGKAGSEDPGARYAPGAWRHGLGVLWRELWHRYLTALRLLAQGRSATEAAHAAGFSDSAHLTRTAVQLNGFTPTKMPFKFWLSNC